MEAIIRLNSKLIALDGRIIEFLMEAFKEIAPVVEDENILQLEAGQRADGTILPDYSPVSVRVFGKRPGPMTLHDTGAFHRGITMIVDEEGIELRGMDIKTEMLQLRYGDDILGLTEESLERLKNDYVVELLIEKLRDYLLE